MLSEMMRRIDEPEHAVLSLDVQAAMGPVVQPERSQFELLVRHLLDRFFNNDMVSVEGEMKKRLIQVAAMIAIPQLIVSLFLYPGYHLPHPLERGFWPQVTDHYFFVMYSFVVMGVVTVFEWELLFPELLDVFVLSTLPISNRRLFWARISALAIFLIAFLAGTNLLGAIFFPLVADLPSLVRHLFAHAVAVGVAGVFIVAAFLGLQGILISVLGQRFSRMISPFLQGASMMLLLTVLILHPLLSMFLQPILESGGGAVRYFPPFWFLGLYEKLLTGSSTLPMFTALARTGFLATALVVFLVVITYPLAYRRRTRQLIEGSAVATTEIWLLKPLRKLLHAVILRIPQRRAVYHFINQTLLRTQRHRVYLAMYGGVGVTLMIASAIVIKPEHGHIRFGVTEYGLRAAIPMLAFWVIAGLRMAVVSPVDARGSWIFGIIHGRPRLDHLAATKMWVFLWGSTLTLAAVACEHMTGPASLRGWKVTLGQVVVALGLNLLLTDAFFMKVKVVPFTKGQSSGERNLAFVIVPYVIYFPLLLSNIVQMEVWIETSARHMVISIFLIAGIHTLMRWGHHRMADEQARRIDLDDAEPMFQGLGLRSD